MRRKILIGVGLFLLALLLSAWLILRSSWLRERLRVWGIAKLEQILDGTVQIDRVEGSLLFDIVLENVRVTPRDGEIPILQFQRGEVGYNPLSFLTANRQIRYVQVLSPVLNLSRHGEVWNFQALFLPKDREEGNPQSGDDPLTVRHVTIRDGSLNLEGVRYVERFRSVNLLGSLTYGDGEMDIRVRSGRGELPGGVRARELTGRVLIGKGTVHLEGVHLVTEASSLFLEGTIADSLTIRLLESQVSLEEVDSYLSLEGVLEGRAKGSIELTRKEEDLNATGNIELPRGRFGAYQVEDVSCSVSLRDQILTLDIARGRMGGGELEGRAVFDFSRGTFRAYGKGARIDINRLLLNVRRDLRSELWGTFRIESKTLPWNKPSFRGEVSLRRSTLAGFDLDTLRARFRTAAGYLQLDSLELRTGEGVLSLKGRVSAQGTDLAIVTSQVELSQIGSAIGLGNLEGSLTSDLFLRGDLSQPSLLGTFWLKDAAIGGTRFEYLSANLDLDRVGRAIKGQAELHFVKGEILGRSWESGDLTLNADGDTFSYALVAAGEELRLDLIGRGLLTGDSLLVEVDTFACQLDGERIENQGRMELTVRGGGLLVRKAHLTWPGGGVEASGTFLPSGNSTLQFSGRSVSLRETCLAFGLKRDLRGEVDFTLDLEGELAKPRMRLAMRGREISYLAGSFDTLDLELSYAGRRLRIDRLDIWREGVKSEVSGSLPLDLSRTDRDELFPDGAISLSAVLNNTGTWVFFPFRQFVEVVSGRVDANLDIGGTWKAPSLRGEFKLDSATMLARFLGTRLTRVNCSASFKEDSLAVRLSGVSEEGEVRVEGRLRLAEFKVTSMDFMVRATGVRVTGIEDVSALVDSDIRIHGSPQEPFFDGTIRVKEAIIAMPFKKRKVGPAGLRSRFALDLAVLGERNIWLRNENADLELGADLRVTRTEGRVFVSGVLDTKRGYIYPPHLDVAFKVTKGEFEFTRSLELDPSLDLEAEYQVIHRPPLQEGSPAPPETVLVKLDVTGTMREPDFRLYSVPPYPLDDVIALLTIGTTRQALASVLAVGRGGERFASYYFKSRFLRQFQRQMPIDAIDFRGEFLGEEEERKAELTVGKYLSQDLYVSYTQDLFARSKNEFKAEYYFWRGAALVGERDEEDRYNLGVQFKFKY